MLPRSFFVVLLLTASLRAAPPGAAPAVPEDFPRFVVPGQEREMESLRRLFWLHYQPAGPLIPLWDEWMPMSTLWPAMGSGRRWTRCGSGGRRRWPVAG